MSETETAEQPAPASQPTRGEVTLLLQRWSKGDQAAADRLLPLLFSELRVMAGRYLREERSSHTLETAALVNEAYLKLVDYSQMQWQNRAHFFAIAAKTMRRILVDHARARTSEKRGGKSRRIPLDEVLHIARERPHQLLALDEALTRLAEEDPDKSRLVELRFFSGLTQKETAEVLGVSLSTVERQWRMARAWLFRILTSE